MSGYYQHQVKENIMSRFDSFQITGTFIIVFCFLTLSFSPLTSDDWPCWRGSKQDGVSNETGFSYKWGKKGPLKLWEKEIGKGYSSVATSGKTVVTMGNSNNMDTVFCFNTTTGKVDWKKSYACKAGSFPGPRATPAIDQGQVFTISRNGDLFCFVLKTGKIKWKKNLQKKFSLKVPRFGFGSSPVIKDDILLINVGNSGLALNKNDGKMIWQSGSQNPGYSTPYIFTMKGQEYTAIFGAKSIDCHQLKTGNIVWSFPWKTQYGVNAATPIVFENYMFISSGYKKGCALLSINSKSAELKWKNVDMKNVINSSVFYKGYLYGFDGNKDDPGIFKCMDSKTGKIKWAKDNLGKGSLMIAGGKLIVLSENGKLVIADASPKSFKPLAQAKVLSGQCWTTPVLSNGKIYCRNHKGTLVCLNVKK